MNALARIDRLPRTLQNLALGRAVPLIGTAGLVIEEFSATHAVVKLPNRRRVRNHLGGVHAAALALCAETATGLVLAINLPEGRVPLLLSMSIDYHRRIRGGVTAVATLDSAERDSLRIFAGGDLIVPVDVRDESGESPATCRFRWAWRQKT
jgi:uncharacterized protein (TIGR00369 family)